MIRFSCRSAPSIIFDYLCRKSEVNVIDAKTMAVDAVAVVELPHRVPYGFHALFVTEVSDHFCHFPCGIIRLFYQSLNTEQ